MESSIKNTRRGSGIFQHAVKETRLHAVNLQHPYIRGSLERPLSFEVKAEDALWICGANGSGKTTLIKCLVGIDNRFQGAVQGQPLYYCGHLTALKHNQTIFKNLAFQLAMMGVQKSPKEIQDVLALFHLENDLNKLVQHLSEGQKRKVVLCAAILSPHKLWVMDEPFTNLDEKSIEKFKMLMASFLNEGGSVVLASHQCPFLDGSKFQTIHL